MAHLNNETITVNAILTRRGRELLASEGGLKISHFALSDDEIDYKLYDPLHPNGSQFFDIALRNTPVLEPLSDETQALKFKLVTLPAGTSKIPVINLGQNEIILSKDFTGNVPIIPTTTPRFNTTLGFTAILSNKNVGRIVGEGLSEESAASQTVPSFLGDTVSATAQTAVGLTFKFFPNNSIQSTTTARLTIVGNETGGSTTIPITITVGADTQE